MSDLEAAEAEPVKDEPVPEEGVGLESERGLAALSYVLTLVTGILVLVLAKPEQTYARWHALQAIGLGVVILVLQAILGIVGGVLALGGLLAGGPEFGFPFLWGFGGALLSNLLGAAILVLVLVLAVKTYGGETVRLPYLAELADRHA